MQNHLLCQGFCSFLCIRQIDFGLMVLAMSQMIMLLLPNMRRFQYILPSRLVKAARNIKNIRFQYYQSHLLSYYERNQEEIINTDFRCQNFLKSQRTLRFIGQPILEISLSFLLFISTAFNISFSSIILIEDCKEQMQKAFFLNRPDKVNKLRLKIQNDKTRILKEDEEIKLPMRTFTLAQPQLAHMGRHKGQSEGKVKRHSKDRVKFKLEHSNVIKDSDFQQKNQQNIRIKMVKQPKMKIQKSFSTSKLIKNTKTETQTNESTENTVDQKNEYILAYEIVEALKDNVLVLQSTILNYSIKKEDLLLLITYLVSHALNFNTHWKKIVNQKNPLYSFLSKKTLQLQTVLRGDAKDRLAVQSNTFDFSYNSRKFQEDQNDSSNKLRKTYEEYSAIYDQIKALREDRAMTLLLIKDIKSQISVHLKQKLDLQSQVYQLKQLQRQLTNTCERKKNILQLINKQSQNMFNYINNESYKRISRISEEYKNIETEIHEFAIYLQSNHMASEINYEPKNFNEVQEVIMDEMNRINRTIIQDMQILPELKERLMRNFILRAMDKFKTKDGEMAKINSFKTMCIRAYIDNMKKWLDNWTLKQQYLANMRKQFIYDSGRLENKLKEIRGAIAEGRVQEFSALIEDIEGISSKIIDNYKLGNSFY